MTTTSTDISHVARIYAVQHAEANLQAMKNTTVQQRLERILRLERFMLDAANQSALADALWHDLRKCREEALATEVATSVSITAHIRRNLHHWARPKPVPAPLSLTGISSHIRYEPKGHVLIIGPWNYPFQLLMVPLANAIAAGNVVTLKPSEHTPATSAFTARMIAELFPESEVAVVEGGVDVATALLELPYHHIFFTGSPAVGKIVMKAAAQHLTSVTLELGGKSPCIVDETANIKTVAEQVAWGKSINAGQTCIAPDYLLIHHSRKAEFLAAYPQAIARMYGNDVAQSPEYPRIVNEKNVRRIQSLVDDAVAKGANLVLGGDVRIADRYIAPCVLDGVTPDMAIMEEEIFGPVLPIMTYTDLAEVPRIVGRLPKPLALYIMSKSRQNQSFILQNTSAGGTVINEVMTTTLNPDLPFGGVNNSGIGKSNGFHAFVEFSNERGVMRRRFLDFKIIYPPYRPRIISLLMRIVRW
jgi:aldehyde dehydrogenase (NAD+)